MFILQIFIVFFIQNSLIASVSLQNVRDDDLTKPTQAMIAEEGYPVESHWVTTSDGYILGIHRIPTGKNGETNGKVAYLQHGLLTSSSDWILFGPRNSLGYILADLGYDVWMGNSRGNMYSRNHTTLDPNADSDFWQFSWHEIGTSDIPTTIDYILDKTGVDSVYYAGHSQGTTSFFVMSSLRPEYNAKIKVQVSLAPIAYMKHVTSPLLKIISLWEGPMETLVGLIGANEFIPTDGFLHMLMESICHEGIGPILCENALFAICGFSLEEMDTSRIPLIVGHAPAGCSTKQLLHYSQEISSGHFRMYDFGLVSNLVKYESIYPPDYDLSTVTAPVFLIYSQNDWLVGSKDLERLYNELGNVQEKILISERWFNHLDYTYGDNAPKLVYNQIVSIFDGY